MNDTKRFMQCGHCGKLAVFKVRAEGEQYGAVLDNSGVLDGQDITTWRILECEWCAKPTLEETFISYEFLADALGIGMQPQSFKITVLYPGAKAPLTNLPDVIEKKYLAALKVQDIEPNACAVLVGRTLEAVCNYEKATGKTLSDKVNNLASSDRIPKTLATMAQQLRQIRNLGAHDDEDEPTEEDVPIMLDFLEAILEHLYVAPAKIAAVQARLKKTS